MCSAFRWKDQEGMYVISRPSEGDKVIFQMICTALEKGNENYSNFCISCWKHLLYILKIVRSKWVVCCGIWPDGGAWAELPSNLAWFISTSIVDNEETYWLTKGDEDHLYCKELGVEVLSWEIKKSVSNIRGGNIIAIERHKKRQDMQPCEWEENITVCE